MIFIMKKFFKIGIKILLLQRELKLNGAIKTISVMIKKLKIYGNLGVIL